MGSGKNDRENVCINEAKPPRGVGCLTVTLKPAIGRTDSPYSFSKRNYELCDREEDGKVIN
jgi:hypothetical protein